MYGGYGIGEPAHPALGVCAARVGRHECPDRDDAGCGIAISIDESHTVSEPGIVDQDPALGGIARQQDEVLVAAESDLRHHRSPGIELGLDGAQVGTDPPGEGYASVR